MLDHRYIARILIESTGPLFVGSGESSLIKDALVMRDANGLPMIPGSALCGVLRHSLEDSSTKEEAEKITDIFGFESENNKDGGGGSRIKVSSAFLVLEKNQVSEGLIEITPEILHIFETLPKRQHVKINDRGVAEKKGLFDNEVVYKGCRFVFEIELAGKSDDKETWQWILDKIQSATFRLGGGTRKGYGSLKIISLSNETFDLKGDDFDRYLNYNVSFSNNLPAESPNERIEDLETYTLNLTPDSFFHFGGNYGDEEVDNKPLEEFVLLYSDNGDLTLEKQTVIPASSIKGALSHRTAFHYNKLKGRNADELFPAMGKEIALALYSGSANKAVNELFGLGAGFDIDNKVSKEKQSQYIQKGKSEDYGNAQRGHVIINDLYFKEDQLSNEKIFNHVAIDRFRGGALDSALFSEKASRLLNDSPITIKINLDKELSDTSLELMAFENALLDICNGYLPLGGMTTKGHGMFTGTLKKNNTEIKEYHTSNNKD